jgi:hypothetical protein
MRSVKLLGPTLFRASALLCGGVIVLTALGRTAYALPTFAPEIDPGSLSTAIGLFAGTALLLTGRRPLN